MTKSVDSNLLSLPETFSGTDNYELKLSNSLIDSTADLSKGELEILYIIFYLVSTKGLGFELSEITLRAMKKFTGNKSNTYYHETRESIRSLSKRYIEIDTGKKGGFLIASWLSSAEYKEDKASIEFSLDEKLRPYLSDFIDNYTIISFFVVIQFHSAHVRRLYLFLKKHENSTMIELSVDEFRKIFKVPDGVHSSFKELKRNLITNPQKKFSEKDKAGNFLSDINFTVKTVREGRRIARLQIFPISQRFQPPLPLHLEDPFEGEKKKIIAYCSEISISRSVCKKWFDTYEISYINEKIEYLKEELKIKEKSNPAGWLVNAIKNDYKNTVKIAKEKEKLEASEKKKIASEKAREKKEKEEQENKERTASLIIRTRFIAGLSESEKMKYVDKINTENLPPSRQIKTANNASFSHHIFQHIDNFENKKSTLAKEKTLAELQEIASSLAPKKQKVTPNKIKRTIPQVDAEKKIKENYINSLSKAEIQEALDKMKKLQPSVKHLISDIWGAVEFPLLRYIIPNYEKKVEKIIR